MIYQPIENTGEYTTGTVYSEEYVKRLEQEIERLNNIINEKDKEIEDYSNKWCELAKAKTKSDNIINELENWLAKEYISGNYMELYRIGLQDSYDKLQELKGDGSNE